MRTTTMSVVSVGSSWALTFTAIIVSLSGIEQWLRISVLMGTLIVTAIQIRKGLKTRARKKRVQEQIEQETEV